MYLGIDVGGTKTLVASLDNKGVIQDEFKFPTPKLYGDFLTQLSATIDKLGVKRFHAAGIGIPDEELDRKSGIAKSFGNLPWRNVPVKTDLEAIVHCPVVIDNDAKLGGLSEAQLQKKASRLLYVPVGTGIGIALIVDRQIDYSISDVGGYGMILEHDGKLESWETFASGHAIYEQFGMKASEITDEAAWQSIAYNLMLGLVDLIALTQPDLVVIGGGIGTHFKKYQRYLHDYLKQYQGPLLSIPPIKAAGRPEKAVVYGCYDLARSTYGKAITVA